jgi:hypothetical protein
MSDQVADTLQRLFRHTHDCLLTQQGESLAYVRDQMGHSSIKVTVDTYGHLVPGANRQTVNRLDDSSHRTQRTNRQAINRLDELSRVSKSAPLLHPGPRSRLNGKVG